MSAFLTPDELYTLTGYKRVNCQIAWLRRNAIPHHVNALGRPVVWRDQSKPQPVAYKPIGRVA